MHGQVDRGAFTAKIDLSQRLLARERTAQREQLADVGRQFAQVLEDAQKAIAPPADEAQRVQKEMDEQLAAVAAQADALREEVVAADKAMAEETARAEREVTAKRDEAQQAVDAARDKAAADGLGDTATQDGTDDVPNCRHADRHARRQHARANHGRDGVGRVVRIEDDGGSQRWTFRVPAPLARYIAVKGSICVDGTSLTVNTVEADTFGVTLIPHTLAVTTFGARKAGDAVNIEVDLMARYAERLFAQGSSGDKA